MSGKTEQIIVQHHIHLQRTMWHSVMIGQYGRSNPSSEIFRFRPLSLTTLRQGNMHILRRLYDLFPIAMNTLTSDRREISDRNEHCCLLDARPAQYCTHVTVPPHYMKQCV